MLPPKNHFQQPCRRARAARRRRRNLEFALRLDIRRLDTALDGFVSSMMLGGSWRPALEDIAAAAGATTAALTRSTATELRMLPVGGPAGQAYDDIRAGRTPRYSSNILILQRGDAGFRSDAAPRVRERLDREPFFRDYMKPAVDMTHRIAAWLADPHDRNGVAVSFYRGAREGPFAPAEMARLDAILPELRRGALLSRYVFAQRDLEQSMLRRRSGEIVLRFDFAGELLEESAAEVAALGDPLRMAGTRLATAAPGEQARVDALIHNALCERKTSGAAALTRLRDGTRLFLLVVPVRGEAAEVFAPVSAFGVLIDPASRRAPLAEATAALREAVGLTGREADVAALIAAGLSPREAALRLGIGEQTVRTHLKLALAKCGVHSQLELAALVARFQPAIGV
jgi:DNA-binding CsgD family transcriptional regulator